MSNSERDGEEYGGAVQHSSTHVIEQGGEVHLEGSSERLRADRIEFLPSGMVKLVFKSSYEKQYHPRESIEGIYTHTKQEEEEDWW